MVLCCANDGGIAYKGDREQLEPRVVLDLALKVGSEGGYRGTGAERQYIRDVSWEPFAATVCEKCATGTGF